MSVRHLHINSGSPIFNLFLSFTMSSADVQHLSPGIFYKSIVISGAVLFLFYVLLYGDNQRIPFELIRRKTLKFSDSPTNISHIRFVLAGSIRTWKYRRPYIEAWWRPNETRGNIFLDSPPTEEFLPWPSTSPPFQVNEDLTKLRVYPNLVDPIQIRMYRSILEAYRLGDNKDVRWYVMGDDDTLIFVDNLVNVLSKYDHGKYNYIGRNSESVKSNYDFSFDMAFGGAGYALSFPLVEALAPVIDKCIERYPRLKVSDYLSSSCSADLGVGLTIEKGIHQIDLHGDISGFLSSHPPCPLLSLHHFDAIEPFFPFKSRYESIDHLMKAAKVDQSRLLQQTICYHRPSNWSFSVSWGYSAHIYESTIPRSVLRRPIETFSPWKRDRPPLFMFNTRWPSNDPCEAPHVFFLDSVQKMENNLVLTTYNRTSARNLPPCSFTGNHSADSVTQIQVLLNFTSRKEDGIIECCDMEYVAGTGVADVKLRTCRKGEVIA